METEKKQTEQLLCLKNRAVLELNGVRDVIRFDEDSALLQTEYGRLTVEGAALHVRVLEPEAGNLVIDGRINGLFYEEETDGEKRGLLGRLFH